MKLQQRPGAPGARILGLGHYQPANVVTNADLIARGIDSTDEWIMTRIGIAERRHSIDESIVDMSEQAASKAIATSGVAASEIDLVIVATCSMPTPVPNASAQLAARLGITAPAAFDVNTACSGFAYALATASSLIQTGAARHALVVGAERLSYWTDFEDRATVFIWSDGAGAAVVGPSEEQGIGPVVWGSDGAQHHAIEIEEGTRHLHQQGQAVFRWATSAIAPVAVEACARAGVAPSELAAFIPHQANVRIIDSIAKKIGADNAVIAKDIVTAGNTSSASVPMAFSRLVERGEIPSGAPVLLLGFGAGLTYASQVVLSP